MQFDYKSYRNLIELLKKHGYIISSYHNWQQESRCVILRHDIDESIKKALQLAKVENEMGISSTYFVLLTGEHYNIFAIRNQEMLKEIIALGHNIGIHFDEVNYPETMGNLEKIKEKILYEANLLAEVIGKPVELVSMHRPSKAVLEADLQIPGMINSYGREYFKGFKYLSDSRHYWREPVIEIVESEEYNRLHILTHAFLYHEDDLSFHDAVRAFVNVANLERYDIFHRNTKNMSEVMTKEEVLYEKALSRYYYDVK